MGLSSFNDNYPLAGYWPRTGNDEGRNPKDEGQHRKPEGNPSAEGPKPPAMPDESTQSEKAAIAKSEIGAVPPLNQTPLCTILDRHGPKNPYLRLSRNDAVGN